MSKLVKIKLYIRNLLTKPLVRGSLWLLLGKGMRLVLQAAYFVIITRVLGVENYGAFIGTTALVALVSPFVGIGMDMLLLKNVAIDKSLFKEYWGNALLMITVTGLIFISLLATVSPIFLPKSISPLLILIIAVSDLIFGSIQGLAEISFQSVDRLTVSAQISIFNMFAKVLAALSLITFFTQPNVIDWAYLYLASSASTALLCVLLVHRSIGGPKLALARIRPELAEGMYFSISSSAYTIYCDIDKTMLARLSTLQATGIYAAAYRLIDVAFIPVSSILSAAYVSFFRKGKDGIGAALKFSKPLLGISAGYGIAIGIGLFFLAPLVPIILGNEYANVSEALRWLAPIPLLRAIQHFAADILSGTGFQGLRSSIQMAIAVFNVAINFWLIPLYSWRGAAWSSLISDGLLMLILWSIVYYLDKQQRAIG